MNTALKEASINDPPNTTTEPKKAADPTEYVVLEQTNTTWREFARETARSAPAAIKAALEGNTDGGTYIAVPARSWRPVKVTPETTTTLKLEAS